MVTGDRQVRNDLSGIVTGPVIQAGSVGHVTINQPAADFVVPSQLPPAPHSFTSRDRELSLLHGWLEREDGRPLVAVVSGAGGIGKSTLALRWLHDVRDRFPDGQLFVDLGAFAPTGPVEPEQVLEWFLLALGVPAAAVPMGLRQRQALYRSMTADRAVAVLLDNAFSGAQVRPLLTASSRSVVVVTSRWRLAGLSLDGARFVELDPLSVDDSMQLLDNIVGSGRLTERQETEELARLCGGMPIALSVVGARLSAYPHRTVTRELRTLRNDDRLATLTVDEHSVEAVFDVSYQELPIPHARTYRICALHPGSAFGVDVAAEAVGSDVEDIEEFLGDLVDRNLIKEVGERRFRYHDLLLLHARRQAQRKDPESEQRAAVQRMVEWYLDQAVAADLMLRPTRRRVGPRFQVRTEAGFASRQEALAWLADERHNILHAVRSSDEHGWDDLTWEFCEAMWGFFLYVRNYGDWIEMHRMGIPAAQRSGHASAEARLRVQLAFALTALHRYDAAISEHETALRLADEARDEFTKATALGELAGAVEAKGDLPGALRYLTQAKEIRDRIGPERAIASSQWRIGVVLARLGRLDEAIRTLREAADVLSGIDQGQYARVLTSLGAVYLRCGRGGEALTPLTTALEIVRALGASHHEAEVLVVLGDLAWQREQVDEAHESWMAAERIYRASGDPKVAAVGDRLAKIPSPRTSDS
jgi:tetratricopeptide (TPR) repeat protein